MRRIITIFSLAMSLTALAQVAPSPDAMVVANAGNPEDLYRGYVSEIVPLYNVTANNGYQVPIQLVYQTRGIKVNDIASSVGLGWNLSAGGAITRVMRDQPDDQSTFTENITSSIINADQVTGTKGYDFEKDIFYISYPGGNGKFLSTATKMTGVAATRTSFYGLPYHDLKIEFYKTSDLDSRFEVTDTQGIRYIFGQTANARETTHSVSYEQGQSAKANEDWTYISTWYLEKIVFPDLPDNIDNWIQFFYVNDQQLSTSNTVSSKSYDLIEDNTMYITWRTDGLNYLTFTDPYSLANPNINPKPTITFNFGVELPFFFPSGPKLPNDPDYTGFPVYAHYSDAHMLTNNCADIPNCAAAFGAYSNYQLSPDFNLTAGNETLIADADKFRSKAFQYYRAEEGSSSVTNIVSDVTINSSRLTGISSLKQDVAFNWTSRSDISTLEKISGIDVKDHHNNTVFDFDFTYSYFEAGCGTPSDCKRLKLEELSKNGQTIVELTYMDEATTPLNLPARSALHKDRYGYYKSSVNGEFGRVNYLNISNPNDSGFPDQNEMPFSNYSGNIVQLGDYNRSPSNDAKASSLWKVKYLGGAVKTFTYGIKSSGGITISNIKLNDGQGNDVVDKTYEYSEPYQMKSSLQTPIALTVNLFSESPYLGYDHLSIGGYRYVTVTDNMIGSSTEYEFEEGSLGSFTRRRRSSNWLLLETYFTDDVGPTLPPPFSPLFGLPKNITVKDELDGKVQYQEYEYDNSSANEFVFKEHVISRADNGQYFVTWDLQELRPFYVDWSQTSLYDDEQLISTTRTTYTYDNTNKTLPKAILSERTDGFGAEAFEEATKLYYALDQGNIDIIHSTNVLNDMVSKNMIGIPVKTLNFIRYPGEAAYEVTNGSLTTFRTQSGLIKPYERYTAELQEPILQSTFNSSHLRLRTTESYYPSGLISSMTNDDTGITTSYSYDAQGYMTSKTIDPTPGIAGMEQTTTYTYEPLVGISTITDATGETITYEYDDRNRLHLIRDDDNNILKRYRYNYAEDDNDLSAEIEIVGPTIEGTSQQISAVINAYGSSETRWYGPSDNQIASNTTSFNHTFFGTGSKSVKLMVFNPEYDEPLNVTGSKIFSGEWSIGSIVGIETVCVIEEPISGNGDISESYFVEIDGIGTTCDNTYAGGYQYQWQHDHSGSWSNFGINESLVHLPNELLLAAGSFNIRVLVTDGNCTATKTSSVKTITVENCPGGGPGGGGPGGGGPGGGGSGGGGSGGGNTWAVTTGTLQVDPCESDPAIFFIANVSEGSGGSCTSSSYSWEVQRPGSSTWISLGSSGSNNQTSFTPFEIIGGVSAVGNRLYRIRAKYSNSCIPSGVVDTNGVEILFGTC